jgi:hypothetical protein
MPSRRALSGLLAVLVSSGCGLIIGLDDHGLLEDGGDAALDAAIDGTGPPDATSGGDGLGPDAPADVDAFDAAGPRPNRIFITSTVFRNTALGGSAGADEACKAHALDAGLDGSFVALISTSSQGLGARVARARGWVRLDGRAVADTPDQLVAGNLWYPVTLDEHQVVPAADPFMATGATPDGGASFTCDDWTAADAGAEYVCGYWPAGTSAYLYGGTCSCNVQFRLYCLETTRKVPVSPPRVEGRFAFVTHSSFTADGGLSGADTLCKTEAAAAKLDGGYQALLATSDASAASRFDVRAGAPTWVRSDGLPIFASAADMPTDKIETPIVFGADGTRIPGAFVWAGGKNAGDVGAPGGASTCGDWTGTQSATAGLVGSVRGQYSGVPGWFGNFGNLPCSFSNRVYCFQE